MSIVVSQEVVLREFVDTSDLHNSSVCDQCFTEFNLVASQVAITDELLARLIHVKRLWQSLSSQIHGERVPTVVGEVHLPDLDCVVRQEVMPLELEVSALRVKSKNFSIVIQELFLGWNAATAELLFEELQQLWILLWWNWLLGLHETVIWAILCIGLWRFDVKEEFTRVLVAVVDPDGPTANANIEADSEVSWLERHLRSVLLQHHLTVEEGALHRACIHLFWLDHKDGSVLKEVVDNQLSNSEVLEARLNDTLLEISEKSQHLFVKLDEGGLEQLSNVGRLMVGVLHVTQTLAHFCFVLQEDLLDLAWQCMQWHINILGVSDFL